MVSVAWIPKIGAEFAGYRLDSLLGHGGMSIVYRAEHLALGRTVALKLLSPQLSEDESFRERFTRESRMAAALDHPNVIPIYEAGEDDDVFFIAMRFVDGLDLKNTLKRDHPLDTSRVSSLIGQVAGALGAAHAKGLVHRDVKPANVLIASGQGIEEDDHAYLSDFGVAKHSASKVLTKTGIFVGTVDYAAPEQIEGRELDGRADIYALGCVLYECLTGAPVYDKDSEVALMYAHLLEPPPSVIALRPDLPPEIDEVVATAMAKSRDDRYSSPKELAAATRAVLGGTGTRDSATTLAPSRPGAGETVMARAAAPTPGAAEGGPATPDAGGGDGASEGGGDGDGDGDGGVPAGARPSPGNRRLLVGGLALAALLAIAIVAAVVLSGGDDGTSATPPTTAATATTGGTTTQAGPATLGLAQLVETPLWKHCNVLQDPKANALESAICPGPSGVSDFFPDRWEVSTYPDAASLSAAYEAERAAGNVGQDAGRCDGGSWGGNGPWAHGPGKPGGHRLCYFSGNDAVIVWTHEKLGQPNHLDMLAVAREGGSDHARLFNWWRFWHHRIGKGA